MSLQSTLASGRFVLTAEITPPVSVDPADLMKKAEPMKGLADAVNVTDSASARAALDPVAAAAILVQNGLEPILQLTARDRNRIALQAALLGAHALGVRNVTFMTGDDPTKGDQPDAKPVFDYDSSALAGLAVRMRDTGELPSGRKIGGKVEFFVGATDAPVDPPADWEPKGLRKKIESGAQFLQTQFCMDAGVAGRYVAKLREKGITTPLLFGVVPYLSLKQAQWIKSNLFGSIIPDAHIARMEAAADPKAEGVAICVDYLRELQGTPGIAGAHIMAPLNEASIAEVLRRMRA
ncbi:MAG: methylenetetrahydrofolate reductase [Hyphomonadaceae bacterium]|nr:methylenetetrahydrofolate reductase [Hyphomonadaceae bacterium]